MDRRQWLASLKPGQEVAIVRDTPTARRGGISTRIVQLATVQGVNAWQATVQGIAFRLTARSGPPGTSYTGERLETVDYAEFLSLDNRFRAAFGILKGQAEHARLTLALQRVPLGMDVGVITPDLIERLETAASLQESIRRLQIQLWGTLETVGDDLNQRLDIWSASLLEK